MLTLISFLVEAALFVIAAGLVLGLLAGSVLTLFRWSAAAFGFAYAFVTHMGERLTDLATTVVAFRLQGAVPKAKVLQARIASLETDLAEALDRVAALTKRVEDLRTKLRRSGEPAGARIYAEVGLHPNSPDFLVRAARHAYRKNYHPDVCPSVPPEEATRIFQASENTFEKIWSLRGLN